MGGAGTIAGINRSTDTRGQGEIVGGSEKLSSEKSKLIWKIWIGHEKPVEQIELHLVAGSYDVLLISIVI